MGERGIFNRAGDRGDGGQMKDAVHPSTRLSTGLPVPDIAGHDLQIGEERAQILTGTCAEIIQDANLPSFPEETLHQMTADKSCPTGYQGLSCHIHALLVS